MALYMFCLLNKLTGDSEVFYSVNSICSVRRKLMCAWINLIISDNDEYFYSKLYLHVVVFII